MPRIMHRKVERTRPQVQTRATFVPGTANDEARTVDVIWTTGAEGERAEWDGEVWLESLRVDEQSVRLGRLNSGAPVLDSHQSYELSNQIGVVERAWIVDGIGHATLRIANTPELDSTWAKIRDGIIRNISVGYVVYRYEVQEAANDGEPRRMVATDWEPMEISFVPVPFDAGAQVRGGKSPRMFTAEVVQRTKGKTPMKGKIRTLRARIRDLRAAIAKAREVEDEAAISEAQDELEQVQAALDDALDTLEDGAGDNLETDPTDPPVDDVPPVPGAAAADDMEGSEEERRGIQAERRRQADIRTMARQFPGVVTEHQVDQMIARGMTLSQAQNTVLLAVAQRSQSLSVTSVHNGSPAPTQQRELDALGAAILHRANPRRHKPTDASNRFRGFSLMDMGRQCIEMAGGRVDGLSRREIAQLALNVASPRNQRAAGMHSTSDFPLILGNVIDRSLRAAYAETEPTWMPLGRREDVNDFRQRTIVALGDTTSFEEVKEGGEYKYGTMPEEGNTYKVGKYGKIIAFTWEAMVNDDLGAFDRVPQSLSVAARQTESDLVWGMILSNPTWIDGQNIYSTAHGNYVATGQGGPITVASLGAARTAMRRQKGINGQNFINITPRFLVVGPERELEAQQFLSPNFVPVQSGQINPFVNTLTLIVEPRITDGSWFIVGDGADTFVYSYLNGEDGLFTETREGFEVDGVEVKARLVFGSAFVDYRSFYYNAGK